MVDRSGPPLPYNDLPARFLAEVRAAASSGRDPPPPDDLIAIATQARLRGNLIQLIGSQTPDLGRAVREYIDDVADRLDTESDKAEVVVELFDRAGLPVSTAAVLSGVGLLVSLGFAFTSLSVLIGGAVGLSVCGTSRTKLKLSANSSRTSARRLRRLADELKGS